MNISHSSATDLWYTPTLIVEKAKQVLGTIDLDPASDEFGNARVGATTIINREQNGLTTDWSTDCSIFINPPGGKTGNKSNMSLFWQKLMHYKDGGHLKHAIFLAFSLEAFQNSQGKGVQSMAEFSFCIPAKRIRFDSQHGAPSSPSHGNAIIYVAGSVDESEKFKEVFSSVGIVRV